MKNDNKKLLDLLKELTSVQVARAKIEAAIFVKEGQDQIKAKLEEQKQYIKDQAKLYGQDIEKHDTAYSEIMSNFEQAYEQVNAIYEKQMANIQAERQDAEEKGVQKRLDRQELLNEKERIKESPEYKKYLKEKADIELKLSEAKTIGELKSARSEAKKKKNPLAEINKSLSENAEEIENFEDIAKMCDNKIVECKNNRWNSIAELHEDKNNKLEVLKKPTIVQRLSSFLMNRVSGARRFKNNVLNPLSEEIKLILTERVPEITNSVIAKTIEFVEKANEKRLEIEERAKNTKEKIIETAKDTKDDVLEFADGVKQYMQGKVQIAREDVKDGIEKGKQKANDIKGLVVSRGEEGIKNIINYGFESRSNLINKAQERLTSSQEKLSQRQEMFNEKFGEKDENSDIGELGEKE